MIASTRLTAIGVPLCCGRQPNFGILAVVGKGARNREKRKREQGDDVRTVIGEYDPEAYPPELLFSDKTAGQLGAPIDGWIPELIYHTRY